MILETEQKTTLAGATLIQDFAAYNAWANKRLVDWLQTKSAELMDEVVPSSFPGLKETLVHIWDTERFWLAVVQQVEPPISFRLHGFNGTVDDVFDGIVSQSEAFTDYIQSLSDKSLQEYVTFDTPWVSGTQPRANFIQHCLNHSTYHRGQVVTIGRVLGLTDAPMTDYSFYLLVG
ncbi:DinB family protein [Spirosoma sp. BT702]|uniref:DinB family protein n=1 Tax=Spirosoma profusum TaxID=2771354 RepID=A0A927AUZ4_9BACT|nr:DinB family protein [Spirosoma profusum]MBD2704894.1 DinB family protein [Spirosoma profusum]